MKIKLKHTKFQMIVEAVTVLLLIGMVIYPLVVWKSIPDRIPMHYNFAGEINRWGDKKELIALPIIGVVLYAMLTAVIQFPAIWNIPVTVTDTNSKKVYGCLKSMLIVIKAEMMAVFFYLSYHGTQVRPLSASFTQITLFTVFGTLIFYIIKVVRISKPSKTS